MTDLNDEYKTLTLPAQDGVHPLLVWAYRDRVPEPESRTPPVHPLWVWAYRDRVLGLESRTPPAHVCAPRWVCFIKSQM